MKEKLEVGSNRELKMQNFSVATTPLLQNPTFDFRLYPSYFIYTSVNASINDKVP